MAQNLKIHVQGEHGEGLVACCGEKFQVALKFHRHQKKCASCKKIKAKSDKAEEKLMAKIKKQQACKK